MLADRVAQQTPVGASERRPPVLAMPRDGVPVAVPSPRRPAPLDVANPQDRRIRASMRSGRTAPPLVDETALRYLGITEEDVADTAAAEGAELSRRVRRYRPDRPASVAA